MYVMKKTNYILLFVCLLIFNACKKKELSATQPVDFTATAYQTLGGYDSTGKPGYLLTRDTISAAMLTYINTTLPNGKDLRVTNPDLLKKPAIGDITITQSSDVYITFVKQDGGFSSSIAFYTYPTGQSPQKATEIKVITYVFPNAGGYTPLQAGDKVKIGRFNAGTSIGFVLMQKAWSTTTKSLDNTAVHFCTNDALNPETDPNLKKHAVLINYAPENKVLIGFEDTDRTTPQCDNDFNDVVIYCTVTP